MTESILSASPSTPSAHLITKSLQILKEDIWSNICFITNAFRISTICSATKAKSLDIGALTKSWHISILPHALWRHKQLIKKLKLCYRDEHGIYVHYIVNKMTC